jgi:hypothetical protein
MRRARLAELTAALAIVASTTSACSLLTSLDGLSGSPASDVPDGDARADVDATGSTDAASDTSATSDALDAGDDAGPNLHPQGTFETGTCDPWVGFQGTLEIVSTAHSGNGACRACTKPSTTDFFTADDNGAPGPGELGATYRAQVWVRTDPTAPAPPTATLFLREASIASGSFVQLQLNSTPEVPIDATWQRLETTLTFMNPDGYMNLFVGAPASPNACFLLDDAVLQRVK